MPWLVAFTAPASEDHAAKHVVAQNHEAYLPRILERRVVRGRRVDVPRPLFPRYLFVAVKDQWHWLLRTVGVTSVLLTGDGFPAVLDESILNRIREREGSDGYIALPVRPKFRRRQRVRFLQGPFEGRVGIYDGTPAHDRERVLLDILGVSTPVTVPGDCLRAA